MGANMPDVLIHPRTGLRALGLTRAGLPIWPVLGAEDEPPPDPPKGDPPKDPETGFPKDTPVAEMTAEQQAAYYKTQSRKHEARAKKYADYDEVKARADQYDKLAAASKTEQELAVEAAKAAARKEALAEANRKAAPRLVGAEFRAQAAGRLTAEQIAELTEDLDMARYLDDDGEVDTERVARKVNALAPKARTGPTAHGQGTREGTKLTGREAGLAEAQRRFGLDKKQA
jgi:hypothetical protein